ncbi:MAG: flavodoxin family protein [Thermoleophilia bacterium]|nr:flavodoxin family protein [Thermoleophilia bacterium]
MRAHEQESPGLDVRKTVTILVGSPRRRGATFAAAEKFASRLEAIGGVATKIIWLGDYDIGVCRGCKVCITQGEERCPLKDDRDLIIGEMLAADGFVFASPNYSWQVPGLLKVFLDRLAFAMHRPRLHGKTASAIVVEGIGFGKRPLKYLQFTAGSLGFEVVKGTVSKTLEPMTEKAVKKMDERLALHARRFHRQVMKPDYQTPSLLKLAMFRMGRTGIRLHAQGLLDWDYYRDQGWFESDYYYPVRLGWPKKAFGAFLDWFTKRAGLFAVAKD